jgi:hypothetical protein
MALVFTAFLDRFLPLDYNKRCACPGNKLSETASKAASDVPLGYRYTVLCTSGLLGG